jgi:glycosyltransferase involved in cell wall biosynthesis
MSTIKVLHVIARMNVGGTARYVTELVEGIPNSHLATGIIQEGELEVSNLETMPKTQLQSLGRKISIVNDLKSWNELRLLVSRLGPDIVHTHTFKAGLIGRLLPGSHVRIHTFHGHLFNDRSFSRLHLLLIGLTERILALRSDLLITVGEQVGKDLRARRIGRSQEWKSIPPGVKPLKQISKRAARSKLGLSPETVLVGWLARMTEVKNPVLLFEIARLLPELQFVMGGGGHMFDEVKLMAPTNVSILGWVDAATFWSAVDIAISTSENEGMPISLIEAQMAGKPVIATDVGSVGEIIQNHVTGYLTSKSAEEISKRLHEITSNPTALLRMGKAAALHANSLFTSENMINNHRAAYSNFVDGFSG